MKIAQFASRYQYDPELARGMYLYEHRRCFDNIIGYCNTLCYHGKLLPKRGHEESNLMPAMGYLHIDGKGELASSGSRYNLLEAETIAAWLAENQQNIEAHYGKSLHEVVGIVTPLARRYPLSNRRWVNKVSVQARMKSRSPWAPCTLFRERKERLLYSRQSIQNMKMAGLLIAITAC